MIEPIVNYSKDKFNNITTSTIKVTTDLTKFAKNKARRLLEGEGGAGGAGAEGAKKKSGADGEVISEEDDTFVSGYPDKLFSDYTIQNGGFMVYLFCK